MLEKTKRKRSTLVAQGVRVVQIATKGIQVVKKVVHEDMVAVLYSPNYGTGWYSWHGIPELLFDPKLVEMVEAGATVREQQHYVRRNYQNHKLALGDYVMMPELLIAWIPSGTRFRIHEYDGSESVVILDEEDYIVA